MKWQHVYWGLSRVPERLDYALGTNQTKLRLAALMAFEDFKYGCTISRNFPIEVLLYYHLTTQISKALRLSQKEVEGKKTAYFADVEIPPGTLWVTDLTPNICLYKLVERSWISKAMQIRYYKRKRCKK